MARVFPQPVERTPDAPTLAALGRLVRDRGKQSALRIDDDAASQIGVSKDVLSRLENGRPASSRALSIRRLGRLLKIAPEVPKVIGKLL